MTDPKMRIFCNFCISPYLPVLMVDTRKKKEKQKYFLLFVCVFLVVHFFVGCWVILLMRQKQNPFFLLRTIFCLPARKRTQFFIARQPAKSTMRVVNLIFPQLPFVQNQSQVFRVFLFSFLFHSAVYCVL